MTIIVPFVPLRLLLPLLSPPLLPLPTAFSTLAPLLSFLLRLYVVPISSSFLPIFVSPTLLLFCSLFFFRLFPSLSFSPLLLCHALPLPSSPVLLSSAHPTLSSVSLLFYTYIPFPWLLPCSSHRSIHLVLPFHSCPTVILMFHLFYSCLQSTLSSISTAATVLLPFNPNAGKWFQVHTRQATVFDIKLATPRRLGGLLANAYAVFLSIHTNTHFTRVTCAGIYRKVVGAMIL